MESDLETLDRNERWRRFAEDKEEWRKLLEEMKSHPELPRGKKLPLQKWITKMEPK